MHVRSGAPRHEATVTGQRSDREVEETGRCGTVSCDKTTLRAVKQLDPKTKRPRRGRRGFYCTTSWRRRPSHPSVHKTPMSRSPSSFQLFPTSHHCSHAAPSETWVGGTRDDVGCFSRCQVQSSGEHRWLPTLFLPRMQWTE